MLDIETLGVNPGCVVLSIGAVEFSENKLGDTFHVHIDVEDSVKHGLVIEPRTVMWWMEQGDQARKSITTQGVRLNKALDDFSRAFVWKDKRIWCNGASFDFPILKAMFEAANLKTPWPYYNEMDYRTIKNFFSKKQLDELKVKPRIAHDGLEDAMAQAATLQNLLNGEYNLGLAA
jgi:hypothetical protein